MKKNVLLINLGTPLKPNAIEIYRYLTEFLNDRRVVDLPAFIRWPLVNLFIVPFRCHQSMKAYKKIWQTQGSPLLYNSIQLKEALAQELGENYQVELGMRYGIPSIEDALQLFQHQRNLILLPLFPHYSSAATGSALAKCMQLLASQWIIPDLSIKKEFYDHLGFIHAYSKMIQEQLHGLAIEKLLFSFHGLPERHIIKSGCRADCDKKHNCPTIQESNDHCYRAQCYATSNLIAQELQLNESQYLVSFQSRLGRIPWIKPYTDLLLFELRKQNVKRLAVASPSFVVDCLETLEEINIRLRQQWLALGGEELIFIPSLNYHPAWVKALSDIIKL